MALTDEQLEYISDALIPLFQYLEEQVIIDVANRIKESMAYTRTAELEAINMRKLGYSPARIRKEAMKLLKSDPEYRKLVAKNTLEHKKKVKKLLQSIMKSVQAAKDKILSRAADLSFLDDLRVWKQAGKELTDRSFLPQLVDAARQQTSETLKNMTRTTGFKTMSGFEAVENLYQRELDKAMIKICSGTFSQEQVVYDVVHSLAESGLRTIDFSSGYSMQLDTAVKLAIRTGAHQLSGKIMDADILQTGVNLVYVSRHWGARNTDTGHANHEQWQGKVYFIKDGTDYSEEAKRIGQDRIMSLWYATGYSVDGSKANDPLGLYGFNCRHKHHPWFLGVSEMPREDPEPEAVTINGRTYDYYAIEQKKRSMERRIRAMKREREAMKALNMDTKQISKNIKQKIYDYENFCDTAKVKSDINRLRYESGTSDLKKTEAWSKFEEFTDKKSVVKDGKTDIINISNSAKAIDSMYLDVSKEEALYTREDLLSEMQTSEVGRDTIHRIAYSDVKISMINHAQLFDYRGEQQGNNVKIYLANIKNRKVGAQTIIHEMTHYYYGIGHCQHAEAICFAMEKMHILNRNYLTEEEWKQMVKLAVDNYQELEWEDGGYGDYEQFDFVRKDAK